MLISSLPAYLRAAGSACALGLLLPAFAATAQADRIVVDTPLPALSPTEFVDRLVSNLKNLAASSEDGDEARKAGFRAVLARDLETRRMQRFLLSAEQRRSASAEDLAAYDSLFADYITAAYADSIDELVSRTVTITDVVERRPGDFIVRSKLFAADGEERAGIDWRVLQIDGAPLLVDVMVDGLSFNVERRAQFTAIIQKDGFAALIAHMNEQIAAGGAID